MMAALPLSIEQAVLEELRRRTEGRGLRKRVAHDLGVSQATLSLVLRGLRRPSEQIARRLGFRARILWERPATHSSGE